MMESVKSSEKSLAGGTEKKDATEESRPVSVGPSATPSKIKTREDEVFEAAEQRRLWALAATSAAHLISTFTAATPVPDLDEIKKSFVPTTPSDWLKRKATAMTSSSPIKDTAAEDGGLSSDTGTVEMFYDPDANDDDLSVFLGPSDQDLLISQRGKRPKSTVSIQRKKSSIKKETKLSMAEKTIHSARKSLATVTSTKRISSEKGIESPLRTKSIATGLEKKASSASLPDGRSSLGVQESGSGEEHRISGENRGTDEKRLTVESGVGRQGSSFIGGQSHSGSGIGDDNWDMYEERQLDDASTDQEEATEGRYEIADINLDIEESLLGLENLLEDLQLESRITERYKYKLVNKFSILLQALITSQEREFEVIEHLQTKRKILTVLYNFVQSEAELSAKVIVSDEKSEDDGDQGMVLDFHARKSGEVAGGEDGEGGEKQKAHTDSQGLSIEEMAAGTIRDTLLQQKNRLDVLEAIKRIHVLKLKQKEFEKTLLTLHYSRMVKPADLQKEIKEARKVVNDLQLEISSMHQEMGQIQTEVRVQEKAVADEEKLVEKLELEALTKQNEVATLQNKPIHVQKEADREAQKLEQLQDMHDNLCQKHMEGMENFRSYQSKIDKFNADLSNMIREESKLNMQKKSSIRETERLMAQMEALLTREQIMLDRAALMMEKIQQANKLKKKIHDEQQRIFNEASKALRVSQRLERSIRMASEAYINARLAHDKMRAAFDAARPSDEDNNWQKLSKMLEREIQNLKLSLEKKLEESNIKASMVERMKSKLNELYDEQVKSGKELQELIRTTVRKRREREEKSEQCIKLDGQIQRFDQDIKMRELVIEDCNRTDRDLTKQIETYKQKSGVLKLERAQIMNEVVSNKHKLADGRNFLKHLEHETRLLNQKLLDLEKELKGKHYLILNARLARDSIRNDALRSRDKFRYYRGQKDDLHLGNRTLRRELERQKQDIRVIRKNFDKSLSDSNKIAMQVRERIEEICTFHEYIHVYDKILLRGASEITVREIERTKLHSLYEEIRKHVLIVKMNQPDESVFFDKIEKLRKYFYEITDRRRALENQLNEDDNPDRVREINFGLMKTRENIPALEKRLDSIEELLAARDAMGLERTLMENHISKITDDCLIRALHLKDTYGDHVKSMVNTRKNLNLLSRRIDGFICENSLASAQAETAEAAFLRFRKQIADAELKLAKGLPPTKEIEADWVRHQWRKEMLRRAYHKRPGFLRQVKPRHGGEIQAAKLLGTRRKLEEPEKSALGWNFSVVNSESGTVQKYGTPQTKFHNSAVNPRRSRNVRRPSADFKKKSLSDIISITPCVYVFNSQDKFIKQKCARD